MNLDLYLFNLIYGFAHRWWFFDLIGIFFSRYFGYLLIFAAILLILKEKKIVSQIYFFSLISLSLILSRGIIAEAFKFFVSRQRPFSALGIEPLISYNGYDKFMSFPSGHAAFYFALAFSVYLFFQRKSQMWFLIGAGLIAISRVFIGLHWPLDIIAGALIGIVSSLSVKKLLDFEFSKKKAPSLAP